MISRATFERIALVALFGLAILLRLGNLDNVKSRTPDEKAYTALGSAWAQFGAAGLLAMVDEYDHDATASLYPPPTRVGMIRLDAAVMAWTGKRDESAGAIVSCAASIGSAALLVAIGLRFFPAVTMLFALLFYAVSPMELSLARRALADAPLEFVSLALVYIACEISVGARHVAWFALFAACAGVGITLKEPILIPIGAASGWILFTLISKQEWNSVAVLLGALAVGLCAALWWLAGAVGGLGEFFRIVSGRFAANAANDYALDYASGPGYLLPVGLWILTPVAALCALMGLWTAWRSKTPAPTWIAVFFLSQFLVAMAIPHWLNLRYVAAGFAPFYLLAGTGVNAMLTWAGNRSRAFAAGAVVVAIAGAWMDYQRFQTLFVREGTPDLSIRYLLERRVKRPG